ncbi:MAG: alpha/beta hydrolase, partial [Ruminococcaceae bacterium]|nr:alpha/beta hydrolase [Oscillospiraceae bacterium]
GNRKLRLYFLPPLQQVYEKAPIIFMFPGGGLMECDIMQPYSIYQSELAAIRNAGFAVATIEYRVGGEGVHAQQVLTDCMDAVRYVSYYSDVLNVDTQKIVTTGHSSGGHISLLLAYGPHETFDLDQYWSDAEDFHVVGSYALSPGTVFYAGDGPHNGYYSNGASKNASLYPTEEMRHLISPITHVGNGGVPCKILMGEEDELVAAASVAMFKDACDAAGVACEVVWFKNAGHGFESRNGQPVTPNYNTERAKILEFAQACIQ